MGDTVVAAEALTTPALPLLAQLSAIGVRFKLDGDRVLVSPRGVLTPDQRELFRQHEPAVRVLVSILADVDVQHRVTAFRQQFNATPAPHVPAFLYRPDVPYVAARCFSCGDSNDRPTFGRCWRCSLAWRLACRLPISAELADAMDTAKVNA
jgi:hypothetical protein